MTLSELKILFRQKIKVVLGGPADKTRGVGLLAALDALAEEAVAEKADNRGPNLRPSAEKRVRVLSPASFGYADGDATRDTLPTAGLCLGTICIAEFSDATDGTRYQGQVDVLRFDSTPREPVGSGLQVFLDGNFAGPLVPAKWVIQGSEEDLAANIPVLDPARTDYPFPYSVKWPIDGTTRYFGTKAPGGPFPAPVTAEGTADWQPEGAPTPPSFDSTLPVAWLLNATDTPAAYSNVANALEAIDGAGLRLNRFDNTLNRDVIIRAGYVDGQNAALTWSGLLTLAGPTLDNMRLAAAETTTLRIEGECRWLDTTSYTGLRSTVVLAEGSVLILDGPSLSLTTLELDGAAATIVLYGATPDLPLPLPAGVTVQDFRAGQGGVAQSYVDDADADLQDQIDDHYTELVATQNEVDALELVVAGKQNADTYSTLTYASSIALDFNAVANVHTLALTGNITFATALNRALGKTKKVWLKNTTASPVTLTFPSAWIFLPTAPLTLAAGKEAALILECLGTAASDIKAAYSAQS